MPRESGTEIPRQKGSPKSSKVFVLNLPENGIRRTGFARLSALSGSPARLRTLRPQYLVLGNQSFHAAKPLTAPPIRAPSRRCPWRSQYVRKPHVRWEMKG